MELIYICLLIGITLGTVYYYIMHNQKEEKSNIGVIYNVTFHNMSSVPQNLSTTDNKSQILLPGYTTTYNLTYGKIITINALYPNGTTNTSKHLVKSNEIVKINDINSSNNAQGSKDVQFYNNSNFPVIIVEKTKLGNKRWGSDIIPPKTQFLITFVEEGTSWEVIHPTSENQPINSVTISGIIQKIQFDGDNLVVN